MQALRGRRAESAGRPTAPRKASQLARRQQVGQWQLTPRGPERSSQIKKGQTQTVGPRHPQVASDPQAAGLVTQWYPGNG